MAITKKIVKTSKTSMATKANNNNIAEAAANMRVNKRSLGADVSPQRAVALTATKKSPATRSVALKP